MTALAASPRPLQSISKFFLYISITIKVYKNHDESLCNLYSKYLKVSIDKKNVW